MLNVIMKWWTNLETGLTLKNPTVTGLLNRLEEKGFITREQNLNDKRSKFIKMTEESASSTIKVLLNTSSVTKDYEVKVEFTGAENE